MPEPDMILELGLGGRPCPAEILKGVQDAAKAFSPFGDNSRALATCSNPEQIVGTVLLVGLWADDGGDSEEQLRNALRAAGSLKSGSSLGLALRFTKAAIKYLASAAYRERPKKIDSPIGFVRLNKDLDVEILTEQIITKVAGQWKARFAPNISFTMTVQDDMSLQTSAGAPLHLAADITRKLSPNVSKYAFLTFLISPVLGGLILWKGNDVVASAVSPASIRSVGQGLTAQWPLQILTEIAPPDLPGKLTLHWSNLEVGDRGVLTRGFFIPEERVPAAFIDGPSSITATLPAHSARETYRLSTQDLRGALKIRWRIDAVPAGRSTSQEVEFESLGLDPITSHRRLSVLVSDEDGLTASRELSVTFEVTVPEGGQPF